MINSAINNYITIFTIMNIVEFIIGLFMFFVPDKKGAQEYLVCLYGGFFFGMIPFYMLFDTVAAIFIGCIVLSSIFIGINYFWRKKVIPLGVVLLKIILILGSTIFEEYYSVNRLDFYFKAVLFSMVILLVIYLFHDLSEKNKRIFITGLFGVLELSGAIVQFYKIDFIHFDKDFFSKRESISIIMCLFKVDYWTFNYQYLFLFIIIALLFSVCSLSRILSTNAEC